jgi:hypothetical protein
MAPNINVIGAYAWAGAAAKSIEIPATIIEFGASSFTNLSLDSVTFEAGSKLAGILQGAFTNTDIASLVIPASVTTISKFAFQNANIPSFSFEEGSKLDTFHPGTFSGFTTTKLEVPFSVKTIAADTFVDTTGKIGEVVMSGDLRGGTTAKYGFTQPQ